MDILTPDSQDDPHHWSATFGAHCWLALGPWGCLAIHWDVWTAAWVVPLAYLLLWEGLQLALSWRSGRFSGALVWDSVCDATAVAFACYAAASARHGFYADSIACWCASLVVCVVGYVRRANR